MSIKSKIGVKRSFDPRRFGFGFGFGFGSPREVEGSKASHRGGLIHLLELGLRLELGLELGLGLEIELDSGLKKVRVWLGLA